MSRSISRRTAVAGASIVTAAVTVAAFGSLWGSPAVLAQQPAPRGPDGQVTLGPPAGDKGYWSAIDQPALFEDAEAPIAMDEAGRLDDLDDVDRVAPFLPWARALFLYRQRNGLADDPIAQCIPPGGPRQFQMLPGLQFVEQREVGRILVMLGGGNRNWRLIHTDGRPQGEPAVGVLSYYGESVGRWEGDTLVVESSGYSERFWFSNGGLPHTDALRLVERFTRSDRDTLAYEVTIDDPHTYARPWTARGTMTWVPDRDLEEHFCEDSAP